MNPPWWSLPACAREARRLALGSLAGAKPEEPSAVAGPATTAPMGGEALAVVPGTRPPLAGVTRFEAEPDPPVTDPSDGIDAAGGDTVAIPSGGGVIDGTVTEGLVSDGADRVGAGRGGTPRE